MSKTLTRLARLPLEAARQTPQRSFPAIFARGGTSNGLVVLEQDLPPKNLWPSVLSKVMGSPDPYGRQLDGMGSGVSSTSKICILSPPTREDVDVDFTFVQVGIRDGRLDMAGNCGNLSSIVGPVAFNLGMVRGGRGNGVGFRREGEEEEEMVSEVRVFNTNTEKVVRSRFKVGGNPLRFDPTGGYEMDGVPGRGSRIVMSFLDPGGAGTGRTLPTGNGVDVLRLKGGGAVEASLVDVGNPGVFVRVEDLGVDRPESLTPRRVEEDGDLKEKLEEIRRAGAEMMGLDPDVESVPKVVMVFPAGMRRGEGANVRCLAMSMGQAHKAAPLTLALCLGAAARLEGTIPNQLAVGLGEGSGGVVVIEHPSGKVDVGVTVEGGKVVSAELHRTGRVLMKGKVYY
ncbi:PrpF protein [Triangularia verruculosa]|uniref:PrpF protein n=1 Tax=Triangularia verruculosa TaxID=2587418 RepID=A0AAN7AUQ2_9PEZI|nr:PrpF protein [Triangularia verruculosa]